MWALARRGAFWPRAFFTLGISKFVNSNYFPYLCSAKEYKSVALKGKLSILVVAFAAFALVAFTAVPHHHHGVMMCMATEHHEKAHDHDTDHACTGHHHDAGNENADANGHCVAELEYLASTQQEINCKHFSCTLHHPPFPVLPALFVLVNLSDDFATAPGRKHKYRPAVVIVESADAGQSHGLRAPPALLS
jgi:hypothetical protein